MDIRELLDDDEFDPKKLFNEEEYSTLIINREGFSKKDNTNADLIESLIDKNLPREQKDQIFLSLKEAKAQQLLVNAIRTADRMDEKIELTAACWETGLDFTDHFLFFVELACSGEFRLSLEALTVVENCEGKLNEATLSTAMEKAGEAKAKEFPLADDLIEVIKLRIA